MNPVQKYAVGVCCVEIKTSDSKIHCCHIITPFLILFYLTEKIHIKTN